ncbi:MAG: glycosyltransferase family 4 protein [Candidatus Methanofastidiosa archaeon]|nr:glycosyltransferase family 4 protein [Candidatus Methanofastidiosa archaeon]
MKNKKICILSFSNIKRDSRVLREINTFKEKYSLVVIGYGDWENSDNLNFIKLSKTKRNLLFFLKYSFFLIFGKFCPFLYEKAYWIKKEYKQAMNILLSQDFDLIHANDWDALPLSIFATKKKITKVLFDTHEYTPEQGIENILIEIFVKPYKTFLLSKYIRECQYAITVSPKIAALYKKNMKVRMETILNAPYYIRSNLNPIDESKINIIHHGAAVPERHLEEMIKLVQLLDERFFFNFLLISNSNSNYLKKLKRDAQKIAPGRITFYDPIAPNEIVNFINQFDLGLPFIKVKGLNFLYSLPNKFFDFIMAGLGVIINPLPAMEEIVKKYNIGKVAISDSITDIAKLINSLEGEDIYNFKNNSLQLAKIINAENEMNKLENIYNKIL